jgi:predicted Fe-S protein YdhL (DUF1289 family)
MPEDRGKAGPTFRCACGRAHENAERLIKLGWQTLGGGDFAMLAYCPCGDILVIERLADAGQCCVCRRVVTGADGDVKVCVVDVGRHLVLCTGCGRRHPRRAEWLVWKTSQPLQHRAASAMLEPAEGERRRRSEPLEVVRAARPSRRARQP